MNKTATKEQQAVRQENGQYQAWSAPVDIYETKDSYVLRADMPGVAKGDLEITAEGTTLTLIGTRRFERQGQAARSVEYRRAFELDPLIDLTKVSARMEQGVVTVQLPKAEKVRPRKITIAE